MVNGKRVGKLCICCGKHLVESNHSKYCSVCASYSDKIRRAKAKGIDLSTLDLSPKVCECCGMRPVGVGHQKYCNICGKHKSTILYARKHGRDISQLSFTGNRLCEYCGKNSIGRGRRKYCDECGKHASVIELARKQGKYLDLQEHLKSKVCECCGIRPVAVGKRKYCEICFKYKRTIEYARAVKKDITQLPFMGKLLCKCCGIRPVAVGKRKYCEVCANKYSRIHNALNKKQDITKLDFDTVKLCEWCGERPATGYKFCDWCREEAQKAYNNRCRQKRRKARIYIDLDTLDHGEELSLCTKCGKYPRAIGSNICPECKKKHNQAVYQRRYMREHGLDEYIPFKRIKSSICKVCHTEPVLKNRTVCRKCLNESHRIYNITFKHLGDFKPVANPEAYYTVESSNLMCPICRAEYCLPNLPVGRKCQAKIVHYSYYKSWRRILELQGIRVPDINEIKPVECQPRGVCWQCKIKPIKNGTVYCKECMEAVKKLRATEY